ncbi:hypothetical protein BOX37_28530 [Nocardia mangyaensis]|uniref:MHYT domain-containing protein n=1 Tax=Nocardia mangyaensis TaxID=2213200 RepID=A0A1J0VYR3_9NOCA|nr:MHYT domain-containing protein [Nocardia mangyaensis]APE37224.1 hypothetical protein BOX37_28530 [Nocardia mangyaensis]
MAEVLAATGADTFGLGFGVALLAFALSVLGALVAFACARHARYSVRFRVLWLTVAAVSLGGVGVWLANSVALLGLQVPEAPMRYTAALGAAALAIAVVAVFAGLLIAGRDPQLPRTIVGGLVMGLGVGLSTYLTLDALEVRGTIDQSLMLIGAAVLISMVVCTAILQAFHLVRRAWLRPVVAVLFAGGVAAVYYTAITALTFEIDPGHRMPTGFTLFDLVFPMLVLGALGLTVPITAVLVAPDRRDLAQHHQVPAASR